MQKVLTFPQKRDPIWEALLNPSLFHIKSVVAQVLIYRWLFLHISHKMLAENPKSVASEMVSKPPIGEMMGVWAPGGAWGVNWPRLSGSHLASVPWRAKPES